MDGFRYYFTPLTGVLFTFPSRYLFTIGRRHVFSLGRWSSRFPAGFHVSRGTQEPDKGASLVSPTGLAPCIAGRSRPFGYEIGFQLPGATPAAPRPALQHPRYNAGRLDISKVWAVPSSLAATGGIAFAFCSSGY